VFKQWRHHQFEAVAARPVQQGPAQFFDSPRLFRQNIGDVLWQQPSREHGMHRY